MHPLNKKLAFTLVELLIVIAILALLATLILVSTRGIRKESLEIKAQANQVKVKTYCAVNPGFSKLSALNAAGEIKEYYVYCDSYNNMWSETLHQNINDNDWYGAGTVGTAADGYLWATGDLDVKSYTNGGVNDCNEVSAKDMHLFPACQACASLNYAGFAEGWRLPSQRIASHVITDNCDDACAYDNDNFCNPGRQLWEFGLENCNWSSTICTPKDACDTDSGKVIVWDRKATALSYWSSTQRDPGSTWTVNFGNSLVSEMTQCTVPLTYCTP